MPPEPDDAELLAMASAFTLVPYDRMKAVSDVRVEARHAAGDPEAWAIVHLGMNLTTNGDWEFERSPSSRTDEFLAIARWPSARAAIAFFRGHLELRPDGMKPSPVPGGGLP